MEAVVSEHGVHSQFLDSISSFCQRVSNVEDGLCQPFQLYQSNEVLGKDLFCNVKAIADVR